MKGSKYVKDARDALNDRMSLYSSTSNISLSGVKPLRRKFSATDPIASVEDLDAVDPVFECQKLNTDGKGNFVDKLGRKVILKGINLDGAAKLPVSPNMPTYKGNANDYNDIFFDGDNVSFVGRPFPLDEASLHFQRIKSWGYNTIRYIITWEAIEHEGPGKYDEEFINYTTQILRIINEVGGLYVFMDVHQDVWSRYSGGSGAPMWTLYAAGLQPKRFAQTEAALLHNETRFQKDGEPDSFPKMIWPTNYKRLASLVMFTMFFSGKNYFPLLCINGKNIQDYLQDCFFNSIKHFWAGIVKQNQDLIDSGCLMGFETMNEPNCGLMGHGHLGELPASQQLRVGTTPTVFQAMKLGMGLPCEVDSYRISLAGPQKSSVELVDPEGERAWLNPEEAKIVDHHYGWKRSAEWIIGECVFQQVGIWSFDKVDFSRLPKMTVQERLSLTATNTTMIKPHFFNQFSKQHNFEMYSGVKPKVIDMEFFINNNFIDYVIRYKKVIRSVSPDSFFMLQPPVLETPPNLKTDPRKIIDDRTIYCPHYYDGMSLMFKTWNPRYNVDTLGIMRGRYVNPVLGIVFGERAIRNCLKKQFSEMKRECEDYLGPIPILMSETGMPFDMDDKRAYVDGKYSSQTNALDALSYALEGLNMSHAYWCYTSSNCHKWGDRWNNEDFSFWSPEDRNLTFNNQTSMGDYVTSTVSTAAGLIRNARSRRINSKVSTLKQKIKNNEGTQQQIDSIQQELDELDEDSEASDDEYSDMQSLQDSSLIGWTTDNVRYRHTRKCYPSPDGVRAVGAVIRPYVVASCGEILATEFDLRTIKFSLTIALPKGERKNSPTIIFIPNWHFPNLNYHDIYLSSGHIKYNHKHEYLEWYHFEPEVISPNGGGFSESSTLINEPMTKSETIIIKNNSGTLDDLNNQKDDSKGGCIIS